MIFIVQSSVDDPIAHSYEGFPFCKLRAVSKKEAFAQSRKRQTLGVPRQSRGFTRINYCKKLSIVRRLFVICKFTDSGWIDAQ